MCVFARCCIANIKVKLFFLSRVVVADFMTFFLYFPAGVLKLVFSVCNVDIVVAVVAAAANVCMAHIYRLNVSFIVIYCVFDQ